ncbi:MAG: cobalamin B12-binding domain-containing protein [Chloroflexi bacterium]|nr:cobalamin B12-binding domain-containing protein [Chloroflexota bacterium]
MQVHQSRFFAFLRSADFVAARGLIKELTDWGLSPADVLEQVVTASLWALGNGWEEGSISLTQVYMGGRIAEAVAADLLPQERQTASPWARVVTATLADHHGLGQRIVSAYFRAAGARVVSLGVGVEPETVVDRAGEERADLIALSMLMYPSALRVHRVRDLLDRAGLAVPLLVGGAPFNLDRALWKQVGASAMGGNPAEGVAVARQLLGVTS